MIAIPNKFSEEIKFKYLLVGEQFAFEGEVYIKAPHKRGRQQKGADTFHKNFKNNKIVKASPKEY